jgi:hypothetical protein
LSKEIRPKINLISISAGQEREIIGADDRMMAIAPFSIDATMDIIYCPGGMRPFVSVTSNIISYSEDKPNMAVLYRKESGGLFLKNNRTTGVNIRYFIY